MWEQLMAAIKAGDTAEATRLINKIIHNAPLELAKVDENGNTALLLAAQNKMTEVCEKLVSKMSPQDLWLKNKEGVNASRIEFGLTGIMISKVEFDVKDVQYFNDALDLLDQALTYN